MRSSTLTHSTATGLLGAVLSTASHAHDGHGMFGAHWHATDSLGFVALALVVGAAVWLSRK